MVPSKLGIYTWKKMPQDDSVNPFTMQIVLYGNFPVYFEGNKVTLMDNIYLFPYKE